MTSEVLSLVASTSFSTSKVLSSKKDNSCHTVLPKIHLELYLKLGIKIGLLVSFLKMTVCFFVTYICAVLPVYEVKCLCFSGRDEGGRGATPSSISTFASCDMKAF